MEGELEEKKHEELYRCLSSRFFVDINFKQQHYEFLKDNFDSYDTVRNKLKQIYIDYINTFSENEYMHIFLDFLQQNLEFCFKNNLEFKQTSAVIEISQYVFETSFTLRLTSEKSFIVFKEVILRHCLFRPPHSILIFSLENLKAITNHFLHSFYKHYNLYFFALTPNVNVEIRTFEMFQRRFPYTDSLSKGTEIARTDIPLLNEYMIDKETGLTPEQLEEIMKGDSIHMVPAKKREEWMRQKQERERKQKIDKVLQKEIERINNEMEDKMRTQDDEFLTKIQDLKNIKKK